MSKFKPSTVSPGFCSAWAKWKHVLVPVWKVPVLTRPQPPVQAQALPKALACAGALAHNLWQGSWELLGVAAAPKSPPFPLGLVLPQQNPHLSCLIANPQVLLWPLEVHCSLQSCCSTPEVWAHGFSVEPSSPAATGARGFSMESPHSQQPAGADHWEKGVWCVTARFTSASSTAGKYSQGQPIHTLTVRVTAWPYRHEWLVASEISECRVSFVVFKKPVKFYETGEILVMILAWVEM